MHNDRGTPDLPAAARTGRVSVFGSLNADLTVHVARFPSPGETLSGSELIIAPGGKSSNQAVAAALLGSHASLIGAVGADTNGAFLLEQADASGVDVSRVIRDDHHATGTAMIVVDGAGENTIIISPGANGTHRADSLDQSAFAEADVVCLCLEVPMPAVEAAARMGRETGAQVLLNLSPYAAVPPGVLEATDVLLVNRSEAQLVLGMDDVTESWTASLDAFLDCGIRRVIVTLGAHGSVVLDGTAQTADDRVVLIDAVAVDAVDTTGCGDAFTGAVAHSLAAGSSLVDAARFAARTGALAATEYGAQSSYRAFAGLSMVAVTKASDAQRV